MATRRALAADSVVPTKHHVVQFLASVTTADEAVLCAAHGASIIDCKDPSAGALGALEPGLVRAIRRVVPADIPVSATVGDVVADPDVICAAVMRMAASSAELIKIGFFGSDAGGHAAAIEAAGRLELRGQRLIAVFFADLSIPEAATLDQLARAGFAGVMLDTADKAGSPLPDVMTADAISGFLAAARRAGLMAGLAGSLRVEHVPRLLSFAPDVLGFRGALCHSGTRIGTIDSGAVGMIRAAIPRVPAGALLEDAERRWL